ncbi:RNA polymerase sigma-70 factor (ECF subfamily) [Erwinia toletana]|uniref:RNA polymerase sigma-70 factor (ECF subfamily) n=1 Tax=Winslowiella toletana TaxID=92490 RepID=A0ABS4PAY6_9GAMM|nr:sigma-70 family RNA polymerase sigma factor [Winslowiella toletana]MBP2169794.1 RNA polymerase sigma-70 factor (ECF subfamily) [Winslowiella toletana]
MTDTPPNEQVLLLAAVASGDRQALASLYHQTSPHLYAIALRMMRRRSWAEEVLHDSFILVWQRAASYNPELSAPKTWLTHIVRHRAIDCLRMRDNNLEALDEQPQEELMAMSAPAADQLDASQQAQRLTECLGYLSADQRQSITLAYYQGLSHGEISTHLQQPLGSVKSWIRRALDHLKNCVGI